MPTYRIAGLTVAAKMSLPGVLSVDANSSDADVHVVFEPTPEHLAHATNRNAVWESDERNFLWRLPELGRFLATDGTYLAVEPASERTAHDVLPFVLGTGVGALLYQRGRLPLHASAVGLNGRAIVLCASSGVGKSTFAAALCGAGCDFLCDDITAVDVDPAGQPIVWPDGRALKLLDASIDHLGLRDAHVGEVRAGTGKYYVKPPSACSDTQVALQAIYLLHDGPAEDAPSVVPMPPIEAAQALLNHSYRKRLGLATASSRPPVQFTAAILRHAAVFRFTRPRDLRRLDESVALLLAHARAASSPAPGPLRAGA